MEEIDPEAQLFQLANLLEAHEFQVTRASNQLVIRKPPYDLAVTVGCTRRNTDDDRWWFEILDVAFLAEADQITNAAMALKGRLSSTP